LEYLFLHLDWITEGLRSDYLAGWRIAYTKYQMATALISQRHAVLKQFFIVKLRLRLFEFEVLVLGG